MFKQEYARTLISFGRFTSDEVPLVFKKMHEFSTADGFVEISVSMAEMIKYVANEPSVGLFFVQQHAQNAIPNLVNLKNTIGGKAHEINLHTEDLDDSIMMVRSMKDCGLPIADEMIGDIKKSLAIISSKQPKKGLIRRTGSAFQLGITSSWGPAPWHRSVYMSLEDERTGNYLSSVFRSAKERASSFRWSQLESEELRQTKDAKLTSSPHRPLPIAVASTSSYLPEEETDELPLSSQIADETEEEFSVDGSLSNHQVSPLSDNYDKFQADREAKLEEWLGESSNHDGQAGETDAARP